MAKDWLTGNVVTYLLTYLHAIIIIIIIIILLWKQRLYWHFTLKMLQGHFTH